MWSSAHCNGIIEEYQPSLKKRVPLIHIDSGGVLPNEVSRNSIKNKQKKPSSIENAVTWGRILMNKKGNRWILAELTGITGAKQIPSHEQTCTDGFCYRSPLNCIFTGTKEIKFYDWHLKIMFSWLENFMNHFGITFHWL